MVDGVNGADGLFVVEDVEEEANQEQGAALIQLHMVEAVNVLDIG